MKLHKQFLLLHERYGSESEAQVTLAEVAETLDCTHRSALTVIGKMAEADWVRWDSRRGRGKRSGLSFIVTPEEIAAESVAEAIGRGDIRGIAGEPEGGAPPPGMRERLRESLRAYFGHHSETSTGRQIDTLRLPIRQQLHSLDPLRTNLLAESFVVGHVFDGLVRQEESSGDILHALAHHWEAEEEGRLWTFYLRKDVLFHDGRVLTSEDVAYTFERMRRLPERVLYGFMARNIEEVATEGPLAVKMRLKRAHALFLPFLCTSRAAIVPKNALRRGDREFGQRPIGTGPFRVAEFGRDLCVLEAFGPYYMGRAHMDRVEIVNIPWNMQGGDWSGGESDSPFHVWPGFGPVGVPADDGEREAARGESGMPAGEEAPGKGEAHAANKAAAREAARGEVWSRAHAEVFSRKFVTCNTKSGPLRDPALRAAVMAALAERSAAAGAEPGGPGGAEAGEAPAGARDAGAEEPHARRAADGARELPAAGRQAAGAVSGGGTEPPEMPKAPETPALSLLTIPQYRKDAALIKERLERHGYRCRVRIVTVDDFKGRTRLATDLILFSLIRDRDEQLRLFDLYLTMSEHADSKTRLFVRRALRRAADEATPRGRARELDGIETALIAEHQLHVLYETPLQTTYLPRIRGLRFGSQGWIDLRTVWFPPGEALPAAAEKTEESRQR
ncbi:ABC transporter substrate-binding protein [Saccharibacillus alkalitolerans]|uniref:ABC transporter substrate-binding protein n=1 Tax=Saccharibacillus alkalitolerans TaxID=2705290 RepID=A0ABX0F5Z6_9BACL|nr:ABC transporter substrate-binding protein [Saccharibacillus alkalitolerans]NGZ76366.1 ABC transporter substrate-binding protein [Saccharibacillus alkalitolerans]